MELTNIINGKYCQIKFAPEPQQSGWTRLRYELLFTFVGSESPEASDRERLAFFISHLPNDEWLDEVRHPDQYLEWVRRRDAAVDVARCFLAGKGQPDDPLIRDLEDELIDRFTYDCRWFEADVYEALWKLLSRNEKAIKSVMKANWDFPFGSIRELAEQIIQEDFEGTFPRILSNQYICKASSMRRFYQLRRKHHRDELLPDEEQEMWNLQDELIPRAIWHDRTLSVANALADRGNISVKTHLKNYGNFIDGLDALNARAERDPNLKSHRHISETWEMGKKTRGVKSRSSGIVKKSGKNKPQKPRKPLREILKEIM